MTKAVFWRLIPCFLALFSDLSGCIIPMIDMPLSPGKVTYRNVSIRIPAGWHDKLVGGELVLYTGSFIGEDLAICYSILEPSTRPSTDLEAISVMRKLYPEQKMVPIKSDRYFKDKRLHLYCELIRPNGLIRIQGLLYSDNNCVEVSLQSNRGLSMEDSLEASSRVFEGTTVSKLHNEASPKSPEAHNHLASTSKSRYPGGKVFAYEDFSVDLPPRWKAIDAAGVHFFSLDEDAKKVFCFYYIVAPVTSELSSDDEYISGFKMDHPNENIVPLKLNRLVNGIRFRLTFASHGNDGILRLVGSVSRGKTKMMLFGESPKGRTLDQVIKDSYSLVESTEIFAKKQGSASKLASKT